MLCTRLSSLINSRILPCAKFRATISSQKRPRLGSFDSKRAMSAIVKGEDGLPSIVTTQREQDFFDLCLGAATRAGKGTVIRVAGGWVRDKLLGQDNDDVDLALDNVSGEAFGHHLNQHLAALKRERRQESPERGGGGGGGGGDSGRISPSTVKVAVIKANPNQSKHLETATVKVAGLEVDITNLRTETYSDGSRIPEMEFGNEIEVLAGKRFGTAEQDAFRRDLTINSLFFNVSTGLVEDMTGRGLADLADGKVVTPLPPFETFKDDPLRVLRAVRFAHRFQFEVDPAIASAASHPIIVEALVCKVSRERFGKEVEGMLKRWRSFPAALRELHGMGLLPLLLTTDAAATAAEAQAKVAATSASASASASVANDAAAAEAPSAGKKWGAALDALDWLTLLLLDTSQQQPQATASTPAKAADEEEEQGNTKAVDVASLARTAMLAGAVLPLAGETVMTGKKRNKPSRAAAVALLEGLKLKNKDCDDSAAIVDSLPHFAKLASRISSSHSAGSKEGGEDEAAAATQQQPLRVELGLLLRDLKSLWRPALALATAVALQEAAGPVPLPPSPPQPHATGDSESPLPPLSFCAASPAAAQVVAEYEAVSKKVAALGLEDVWAERPLVNGSDLAKALGLGPGPQVGQAMKQQVLWQLEHPQGTAEGCIAALLSAKG